MCCPGDHCKSNATRNDGMTGGEGIQTRESRLSQLHNDSRLATTPDMVKNFISLWTFFKKLVSTAELISLLRDRSGMDGDRRLLPLARLRSSVVTSNGRSQTFSQQNNEATKVTSGNWVRIRVQWENSQSPDQRSSIIGMWNNSGTIKFNVISSAGAGTFLTIGIHYNISNCALKYAINHEMFKS